MKNTIIILGLLGAATTAFGQTTEKKTKPQQITQDGNNNVVKMNMRAVEGDTLTPETMTRTLTQKGNNLIHIESTMSPDSLAQTMENVAIEQKGKRNVISIDSKGGKGNSVQVSQSGSGNSVNIKQN